MDKLRGEEGRASDAGAIKVNLLGQGALIAGSFFLSLGLFSVGVILPGLAADSTLQSQAALIPWVASVASPSFAIASPIAGLLIPRFGVRRLYAVSAIGFVLFGALPFLSDRLWQVVLMRVLMGACVAGALTAALAGIAWLPERRRATLFGLQSVVGALTSMIGLPVMGMLTHAGWRASFLAYLAGVAVLPLILALPSSSAGRADVQAAMEPTRPRSWLAGLPPSLLLFSVVIGIALILLHFLAGAYLRSIGITDPSAAALPLALIAGTSVISGIVYGGLQRRIGTGGVFATGSLAIGAGLIIAANSASITIFTIGGILSGLGMALCMPNLYTAALESNEAMPGSALGLINLAVFGAPIILPLLLPPLVSSLAPGGTLDAMAGLMLCWGAWYAWLSKRALGRLRAGAALRAGWF